MRPNVRALLVGAVLVTMVSGVTPARAQVLGVFRWQTQPYCNLVTVTVIQQGPTYQLTGNDNLCGAPQFAPVTGTATLNPDGSISLGFDVIMPSGAAAHVSATVNLSNVSGTWTDADGNTGPFVFNPPGVSGSPRPAPVRAVAITSAQLAPSVFAGSGSATTIARSDHLHDDRYYTKAQTDALVAAGELIATPGKSVPVLVDEAVFTSLLAETITSSTTGQWLISKTVRAYLTCPSASPLFFLVVDGAPLVSSAVVTTSGSYNSVTMVGATSGPLAAGAHSVSVGADCPGQSYTASSVFFATAATVTVIR